MRRLVVNTFLTLDGVMQAPGRPDEDPSGGFNHGGWLAKYWDNQASERMTELMAKPFDLLIGRRTYEIFAAYWPHAEDQATARPINNATKHVASRTLDRVDWQNSVLIEGDVPSYVAKLKKGSGPEIQVYGSSALLQTLIEHDLIDEYSLFIFPLVLGSGKRLFDEGTIPAGLELISSETSSTGAIIARYERAGDVEYGTIGGEEPTRDEVARGKRLGKKEKVGRT